MGIHIKRQPQDDVLTGFLYGLGDRTANQYKRNLKAFLDFLKIGGTLEEQAASFLRALKRNREDVQRNIMRFMTYQNERAKRKEIVASTIRNYYKAIHKLCEAYDIDIRWKKITRGILPGRRVAKDRAPTRDEIRKLLQDYDPRIKPI